MSYLVERGNNLNKEHPTAVYESINTGLWSDSFFTRINIYYYTKLQNLLNECICTNFLVFVSVVTFFQLELSSSVTYGRFNYQRILLGCTIKSPAKILALTEQYSMSIDFLTSDSVVSCPPQKPDSVVSCPPKKVWLRGVLGTTESASAVSCPPQRSDSVVSCPPQRSDSAASWALQSHLRGFLPTTKV